MSTPALPLEEAQARLLALAPALPVEHRAVADCAGYWVAEPLIAQAPCHTCHTVLERKTPPPHAPIRPA